jgi:hypothetical protein
MAYTNKTGDGQRQRRRRKQNEKEKEEEEKVALGLARQESQKIVWSDFLGTPLYLAGLDESTSNDDHRVILSTTSSIPQALANVLSYKGMPSNISIAPSLLVVMITSPRVLVLKPASQ